MKKAAIKTWVQQWNETGKLLSEIKPKEFEQIDRSEIFLSLTDASEADLIAYPPKPSSRLVEMQKMYRKLLEK